MNNILSIKERIQKYQEKIKDLEEKRKNQIMKEEALIKNICFNTLIKSSKKIQLF